MVTSNRTPEWSYGNEQPPDLVPHPLPLTAISSDHLLKVALAETRDATEVWAELWREFHDHVTPEGTALPELSDGFVPPCGWREFLEKLWLLKHHLDAASRVCRH